MSKKRIPATLRDGKEDINSLMYERRTLDLVWYI